MLPAFDLSQEFIDLVHRCDDLGAGFLPAVSLTGSYLSAEYDRVRAYLLLVHAEIEAYLEVVCWRRVYEAEQQWILDRRPKTILLGLLAFAHGSVKPPPDQRGTGPSTVIVRMEDARQRYWQAVNS